MFFNFYGIFSPIGELRIFVSVRHFFIETFIFGKSEKKCTFIF